MPALPGPSYLAPTWRYAGNDWAGTNALVYTVYQSDAQGNPTTTPMDLTGYTASGTIAYRPRPSVIAGRYEESQGGPPLSGVVGTVIAPTQGLMSLSVQRAGTVVPTQDLADWYGDIASARPEGPSPSGARARLIAQPMVIDPSGNLVTVGLQPLYVFGC